MFISRGFRIEKQKKVCSQKTTVGNGFSRNVAFEFRAAAAAAAGGGKDAYSSELETPFPSDYDELIMQVSVTLN